MCPLSPQVTFEQHKENLSRMFRQYQDQEFAGSGAAVRTVSGVSESSEATKCINGSSAEETAPSTVIELTVDSLSQKSLDSASNSTLTSRPRSDSEPTSITVSNILARDEDKEQKGPEENSSDGLDAGKENEVAVIEMTNSKEADSEPSRSDDSAAEREDKKSENKDVSSTSETENPPEQADEAEQTLSEHAASLDNSGAGGASVFNEDLVDVSSVSDQVQPSDADESLEESYVSAATGEDGDVGEKGDGEEDGKRKVSDQGEEEVKNEEQTESQEQEKGDENTSTDAPQQSDAEAPKEDVSDTQSSSVAASKDQQPSDATPTSSSQEAPNQPSNAGGTTTEETQSSAADTNPSSSDTPKSPDSLSKTKEIKIARLDVSNVALDTKGLELKETSSAVRLCPVSKAFCELNPVIKLLMFFLW